MSQNSGDTGKALLTWVLANFIGFGLLGLLSLAAPALPSRLFGTIAFLLGLVPLSLAQWLALRRIALVSGLWILTVPLGLLLWGAIIFYQLIPDAFSQTFGDESVFSLTFGVLLIGFLVGLPQWLILRPRFPGSSLWLLGSAGGLGFGFYLVLATDLINRSGILACAIVVLVYTLTTGLTLSGLLAYRDRAPAQAITQPES
jgi:hypothetical protein